MGISNGCEVLSVCFGLLVLGRQTFQIQWQSTVGPYPFKNSSIRSSVRQMMCYRTSPKWLTAYVIAYVIMSLIAEAEDVTKPSVASSQDTRKVFQFIPANYLHTPTQHSASTRRRSIKSNTRTHPQIKKKKSSRRQDARSQTKSPSPSPPTNQLTNPPRSAKSRA